MRHDRHFKALIERFARDFLAAFVPDLAAALDDGPLEPLDPATRGEEPHARDRLPDLVLRGRMCGDDAFFLIHIEAQHRHRPDFPARMFAYWVRLRARHDRPVFPIAFLTQDRPRGPAPRTHLETVAGLEVARFSYHVVQLATLRWSDFQEVRNPVVAALLVQMSVAPSELVRVKLESWLKVLALSLSHEQRRFLVGLVEAYSPLSPEQDAEFRTRIEHLAPPIKEELMQEWTNSWLEEGKAKGLAEGRHDGALRAVLRVLGRRTGLPGPDVQARLTGLDAGALEELLDAAIDFTGADELTTWLDAR
jgi:hypothetical protein